MTVTILVIDDSEDDRRLYQRALKEVDCRLVMTSSAQAGLICMADLRPDMILLDYNLPDLDGLGFIKVLAGCSGPSVPVIMLTGEGSETVAVQVMKHGAADYLVKDTAGQYLRLLPGVIERVMALHVQRVQNQRLQQETAMLLHRNQALMQNSMDGIHVMDVQGNVIEANDAFCRMLGYSQEEASGLNVADWNAQWPVEELWARFRNLIGKSAIFETVHRRKDGTLIDVEISTSHVEMDGQDFFFALSRDITERNQSQQALVTARKQAVIEKQRLEAVMQNLPVGVAIIDAQGGVLLANAAYEQIWGSPRPAADSVGDYAAYQAWWTDSGELVRPEEWASARAVRQGETVSGQLMQIQRFDGARAFVMNSAVPTRDAAGQVTGCAVVIQDITTLKRTEERLRETDRHKDEFLAMLAHELRNPLAPIRNAAHVIGRLELAEPKVRWAQEIIERQVNHLARLVDDLLDVSRIARGKIILKREVIEFAALAEQVMQSIWPLAESKGHQLTMRLPDQAVQLEGDPVRLSQLLFNLLGNAVKYTPDGGQIEFAARLAEPEIEISVRDNGMGITPELLPRVFDLFQQDERKLDRAQGGLGIGLTLVRHLTGMHGGRVEVRSAGPGLGSIFTVWLPAKAMHAALPSMPEAGSQSRPATGMRILVVEDNQAVADSTAVLLEMEGHQVRIAESGQAALEQIPEFRPQVVLLDIGLKGMDGFETAQRLRQMPEGRDLCLVAVTGYADSATKAQALDSGCDHFLVKPVTFKVLSDLLDKVAGSGLMFTQG